MATNLQFKMSPASVPAPGTNAVVEVDIRDAKPPIEPANPWFWVMLLGLALVAALAGWWAWRRRSGKVEAPRVTIIVAPHVRARDRLRAALQFLDQPKPYCVAVSDALRVYLEEQFHLQAPERTTEEFLAEVQASAVLSLQQKRILAGFLDQCDLVKFARERPVADELRGLYHVALRLVEETAPPALEPPPSIRRAADSGARHASPRHR